jgi:hypothetical protein
MIVDDLARRTRDDGGWELSARVRSDAALPGDRLWFRVAGASPPPDPIDASPFVPALLLAAMLAGEPLEIDGPVSPRLLASLDEVQRFYRSWFLSRIGETSVMATADAPAPAASGASMCFTAGVDSWFAYVDWIAREPLDAFVWVPSMDRKLDEAALERRRNDLATRADALGHRLVSVSSNLLPLVEPVVLARRIYGPMLAAVGLAVGLPRHLIASSNTPNALELWNTHPMLDPLWSTERTEIVHTGHDAERLEKLSMLADHGIDWTTVRVCHQEAGNCGRCEKCLRTMLGLYAVGVDPAVAFAVPLRPAAVARMRIPVGLIWYWTEIESALRGRDRARDQAYDQRLLLAVRTVLLRVELERTHRAARRWASAAAGVVRSR